MFAFLFHGLGSLTGGGPSCGDQFACRGAAGGRSFEIGRRARWIRRVEGRDVLHKRVGGVEVLVAEFRQIAIRWKGVGVMLAGDLEGRRNKIAVLARSGGEGGGEAVA